MANLDFNQYLKAFKSFTGILSSIGVIIPGFAFFSSYSPPLKLVNILISTLALSIIIITYYYNPNKEGVRGNLPSIIFLSRTILALSVLTLLVYLFLFNYSTVLYQSDLRVQVGFGTENWSLSDVGIKAKGNDLSISKTQLISLFGEDHDTPERLWKPWTIQLAGTLLNLTYIISFSLWTFGWSLLAKQTALSKIELAKEINE